MGPTSWLHDQDQVVHQLDGYKDDRQHSEVYAEHHLALPREKINNFRQADIIRVNNISSSTPPKPTTPMTTFIGHIKGEV